MNENKKLSILIYSLASGGAERVVSILLENLKENYSITLFLMNDTIFYDIPKDIQIVYLEKSLSTENGIKKLLKIPFLAWKYKNMSNSDISLSFMNRPNYVNTLAKIIGMKSKVIISERIAPSQEYKTDTLRDRVSRWMIKTLYPKADIIAPNAIGIKNDLVNFFSIDTDKVKIINNPISMSKIDVLQTEKEEFRDSKFTFITIGRMQPQKNHALMIEAIKHIDAKLYIVGEGELREQIETQVSINSLENKVILLGRQSNPYKYIAKSDCFLFTSNYEGFPNVLLEALSCGLPVISTDCQSGPREILAPSTDIQIQVKKDIELVEYGILTPTNDMYHLEKAMKLIINDEKLRDSYKKKAKNRAKDFSVDKIIGQWLEIIDS